VSEDPLLAKRRIDQFHAQLEKRDHFQLLGVEPETPPEVVKSQYLKLARTWHADAFVETDLGDRKRKLDEIFQRVNEAFEVVSDPGQRAEYLVLLERKKKGLSTDVNAILNAEALVDDALAEMRRSQFASAKSKLQEAIELNGEDPLYRVQLARATYGAAKSSHGAQEEAIDILKAVVKERENIPEAYQYLGQIHFDRGDYQRAIRWWKKCLEWDRKNTDASRGIRLATTRLEKENRPGIVKLFDKLRGKG